MNFLYKQLKQFTLLACLMFCANSVVFAQQKPPKTSKWNRDFVKVAAKANIVFTIPDGFKEITDKSEANPFDYGVVLPGEGFEVWVKIFPLSDSAPDSLYLDMGKNEARMLAGENNYLTRGLPGDVLDEYNADAGISYLISLPDSPVTKHYKFAMLITLQKSHKAIVMAAGFTNDRGPDFFKNLNKVRYCLKFKGPAS